MTPVAEPACCHCGGKSASSRAGVVIAVIVVFVILNVVYVLVRAS